MTINLSLKRSCILNFLAALLIIIYTVWLYHSTFNLGFNSDAFGLLDHVRYGLFHALSWDGTYHYFPITASWLWVQYVFLGFNEPAYQIINILQHGLISVLVFMLALDLIEKRSLALLAGLLYASSANFYEVIFWSIVGNNFHVSSFFYIAGLISFIRFLRKGVQLYYWLFSICLGLALLSHESTLSLVLVCITYYLFVHAPPRDILKVRAWINSEYLTFFRLFFVPLLIVFAFLLMKGVMSLYSDVTGEPQSSMTMIYFFVRGAISAFTLRGDGQFLGQVLGLFGGVHLVWVWLIIGAFGLGLLIIFVFSPVERFLVVWALGHLLMMQLAIGISSRHLYLPTVATTILIPSIGYRFVNGILFPFLKHVPITFARLVSQVVLYGAIFLIFVSPSLQDTKTAEQLWQNVSKANMSLNKVINDAALEQANASTLYLVNLTKNVVVDGFFAWTFQNGTRQKLQMYFPGRFKSVRMVHLNLSSNIANGSQYISLEDAVAAVTNQQNIVIAYYPPENRFVHVTPSLLEDLGLSQLGMFDIPTVYTAESAPYLEWLDGTWPWINLPPELELNLKFKNLEGDQLWLAIFYLAGSGRAMTILEDGNPLVTLTGKSEVNPVWLNETVELSNSGNSLFDIKLRSVGTIPANFARIGIFEPQQIYNIETAKALQWTGGGEISIPTNTELTLPFQRCGENECIFFITYLNEPTRDFSIVFNDQELFRSNTDHTDQLQEPYTWITEEFSLEYTTQPSIMTFRAVGESPVLIREVGFR